MCKNFVETAVVLYLCNEPRTTEIRLTQRAPDPRENAGAGVVGVSAFSGSLYGLELIPLKCRCLVPPTKPLTYTVRQWLAFDFHLLILGYPPCSDSSIF